MVASSINFFFTFYLFLLLKGNPQKATSATVRIVVNDANDNAPIFMKSTFSFFFPENTPVGTPVVTLNATDAGNVATRDLLITAISI